MMLRRTARGTLAALAFALTAAGVAAPATAAPLPTIVLVHGAFADATSWNGVAGLLRDRGYSVLTPDNPLRGPANDAAAIQRTLDTVSGPVVLVGHSYGGAVISSVHDPKVESLVYIAAFAPVQGEPTQLLLDPIRFPGSRLLPPALQLELVDDPKGLAGRNIDGFVAPSHASLVSHPADVAAVIEAAADH